MHTPKVECIGKGKAHKSYEFGIKTSIATTLKCSRGGQFTFPPRYADGPTARYMTHMFDMRFRENGIEHRLTKIKHPWTSGQIERMNRTIKDATVKHYHYDSHEQFIAHLDDFINAHNYARRLKIPRRIEQRSG